MNFDRYVLDLGRGSLLLEDGEIALRPKTFAVLKYLVENPGRLISKDELFAAVWTNIAVTDDTLVQSIGELRRALADDGGRLIKTLPRRGYRFEADVAIASEAHHVTEALTLPTRGDTNPKPIDGTDLRPSWFPPSLRDSRAVWIASLGIAVVLVVGVLWASGGRPWALFGSSVDNPTAQNQRPGTAAIAVLPFVNQSNDTQREYFADGLTQDIINALGRFPELTVMSWNAVLPYRKKPASPREIAQSIAVRYQVEGSVLQTGDRVRVSAQLVDANGRVLWSARFDEALSDLFLLQDKITTQIAGALAIRVTEIEQRRVLAKPTESLEAYDYVLRARPALQRPTRAGIVEARALLRRAIDLDPNYAAAYSALAETFFTTTSMGWAESPTDILGRAEEAAQKALSLDASDVRAHVTLGRIHIFYHRYDQAKAEMDRAIAINSNDAHGLAGRGNILMWAGQTDAAIDALELAKRIDPELNAMDRFALSLAYYLKRRYAAAIEEAELNLRRTAGANFSRILLAAAYAQQDRAADAARVAATIQRVDPTFDPQEFGTKFLNPDDLEHLRAGLRKARLWPDGR